jgi:hypothetical protein
MKFILLISITFLFSLASSAQTVLSGTETKVNTTTSNNQKHPATDMDASGNFIVAWESLDQDSDGYGIYAQRYNSDGTTNGSEFLVNTTTSNDQRFPAVAVDNNGNFVIVWQSMDQDGDGWGIYMQLYDNTGTVLSTEILINGTTTGQQRLPSVAMDGNGNYTVTWDSDFDIYARAYDNTGSALNTEFVVNTTTSDNQSYPDIAIDNSGNFVIVWQSLDQDGDDYGIYGQRYDATPSVVGSEFSINSTTSNNQLSPAVAMDSLGNFAVVWVSNAQDGDAEGIYMQLYDNTGTTVNGETQVNTTTTGAQDNPDIGMTEDGEILVAWNSYDQDGSRFGIYQQAYYFDGSTDAFGLYNSVETQTNTTTTDFQEFPAIAMRTEQTAKVVWQEGANQSSASQDGDDYGIYMQAYIVPGGAFLPIELLNFDAKRNNPDVVQLNWSTVSETNNKGFYIERMLENELDFSSVAWVDGNGTTTATLEYNSTDANSYTEVSYYRLQQVDFDGSITYSEIRAVEGIRTNIDLGVSIFPNPVEDELNIRFDELTEDIQTAQIQILSTSGQVLYQSDITIESYQLLTLDIVQTFPPAMYLLSIQFDNGEKVLQKFIKNKG